MSTHMNTLMREFKHEVMMQLSDMDLASLKENNFHNSIVELVNALAKTKKYVLSQTQRSTIVKMCYDHVFGFGVLQELIDDDSVTDILINNYQSVYIERKGKLARAKDQYFSSEAELREYAQQLVSKVNKRIDEMVPYCDARLDGVGRVNAVIPPLGLDGTVISIRKFNKQSYTLEQLMAFGSLTPKILKLLSVFARSRVNLIVSGGTGSGKTTLLNAISQHIPNQYRIITIEDTAELRLLQSHVVRLESRPQSAEGLGEVPIRQLLVNALRMRPDLIVIGECRGAEAFDMIQAMNTGHDGSMSTLHSNGCRDTINRVIAMAMMAQGNNFPVQYIQRQVVSSINVIIHVSRLKSGERKIVEISSLTGIEGETPVLNTLVKYDRYRDCYEMEQVSRNSELYKKISYCGLEEELQSILAD